MVTGGAGFIGSHLVDRLLGAGNEVVVIDDFSSGSKENLSQHAANSNLRVEVADILNEHEMTSLFKGARFVFHLAVRNVRLSLRQPTPVHEINTTGTLNALKASVANKVQRFLYCSSSEVYGTASVVPMAEDYDFKPETVYGASKLTGEHYTLVFHRAGWLPTIVARPFNTYGPREHYDDYKGEVIPRFILRALGGLPPIIYGDGSQTRDFTYVGETADYLVRIMEYDAGLGQVFNICRGEEVSIKEIARIVSDLTDLKVPAQHFPRRPSDVSRLCGDTTRLKQALGTTARVSIGEGLEKTVDWFRRNVPITHEVMASMKVQNWKDLPSESWMQG